MRQPALLLLLVTTAWFPALQTMAAEPTTTLAVPGHTNQWHSAAAEGPFIAVTWSAQNEGGKPDVFVAVSRDGGLHFDAPVRANDVKGEARVGGELPPRVALIPRPGRDPGIVVAYGAKTANTAIKLARSSDGGRTFAAGRELQATGAAGDRGWHALTVDSNGAAHVMWLDHRGMATGKAQSHEHHEAAAMDGAQMAQGSSLYYASDAGSAAEREVLKGVCYCCKVAMVTGRDGALFAAWRHVYPGNIRDIAFTSSRNGGRTFAVPTRISNDDWELAGCPDDGPALAVDGSGTVHAVWPTVIGGDTPEGALFYASSRDGRTFSARTRVPTLGSPRPMHPQIAVDARGRVVVAWDEVIGGVRQAALRTVTIDEAAKPAFGAAVRLGTPGESSSYPMLIPAPSGVLAVYAAGLPGASTIRVTAPE
jgi:hypothetical protein